jgi:hypothetical protein
MKKAVALILGLLIGGGLMVYSATRTVDLLQMTLPVGQKDMAFLALLAFDGGLIAWTLLFMFGAEGGFQRAISAIMIVVSLVGVLAGFGADQVLGAQHGGLIDAASIPEGFGMTITLVTVAIIASHIAAIVFFHVLSPENRRRMQEESFKDQIEDAAQAKSNEQIPHLAAELAIQMTASRMARLSAVYQNMIASEMAALPAPVRATLATKPADVVEDKPGVLDGIKARLSEVLASGTGTSGGDGRAAATSTLATDGEPAGEVVSAPKPLRARKS